MKKRTIFKALLPLGLLALSAPSYSQSLKIKKIKTGGTGCPNGTVTTSISNDQKAFTLIFDEFFVELAGRRPSQRRACQIDLTMKVPAGWSYSIGRFDYRGYGYLEPGVQGTQTALYYFQGSGQSDVFTTRFGGNREFDDIYTVSDTIGINAMVWSPCGVNRNLQIKTDLRLQRRNSRSNAYGYLSTDSLDGEFKTKHKYKFWWQWRRC